MTETTPAPTVWAYDIECADLADTSRDDRRAIRIAEFEAAAAEHEVITLDIPNRELGPILDDLRALTIAFRSAHETEVVVATAADAEAVRKLI